MHRLLAQLAICIALVILPESTIAQHGTTATKSADVLTSKVLYNPADLRLYNLRMQSELLLPRGSLRDHVTSMGTQISIWIVDRQYTRIDTAIPIAILFDNNFMIYSTRGFVGGPPYSMTMEGMHEVIKSFRYALVKLMKNVPPNAHGITYVDDAMSSQSWNGPRRLVIWMRLAERQFCIVLPVTKTEPISDRSDLPVPTSAGDSILDLTREMLWQYEQCLHNVWHTLPFNIYVPVVYTFKYTDGTSKHPFFNEILIRHYDPPPMEQIPLPQRAVSP